MESFIYTCSKCGYSGSHYAFRWGWVKKPIKDQPGRTSEQRGFICHCGCDDITVTKGAEYGS